MVKRGFFSVLVLTLLSFVAHKYYVSITEVELNPKTETLEISIKFIGHDLEAALESAGVPDLYLGIEKENEKADAYLLTYIQQHFEIKIDGNLLPYHFVGKEINNEDFIYCYLESGKVNSPNKIAFTNTLLTEKFNEQANILYLEIGDTKLNYTFTKEKRKTFYTIKE